MMKEKTQAPAEVTLCGLALDLIDDLTETVSNIRSVNLLLSIVREHYPTDCIAFVDECLGKQVEECSTCLNGIIQLGIRSEERAQQKLNAANVLWEAISHTEVSA